MLKATANNALGFAFQLAIKSISPQIASTIEEMAQKAQQMNQFNAEQLRDRSKSRRRCGESDRMSSRSASRSATARGSSTGERPSRMRDRRSARSTIAANSDPNIPSESYNHVGYAEAGYPSFSPNSASTS